MQNTLFLLRTRLAGVQSRVSRYSPVGKLWPNGEFSLGYVGSGGDERLDERGAELYSVGHEAAVRRNGGGTPLNLRDAPNSHKPEKPRTKRGGKGITGYGRKMVRNAGHIISREFGRSRVTFATVTLPPMDEADRRASVECWGEFIRQALQVVRRRAIEASVPPLVVAVTEIQPKRLQGTGEGYLHVHLVWLNPPAGRGSWILSPNRMRQFCESFWRSRLPSGAVGHINVNVKRVKGDCCLYLAKYMSKGGAELAAAREDWGEAGTPATWWNMTAETRRLIKAGIVSGGRAGALMECLLHHAWECGPSLVFCYLRHAEVLIDGGLVTVGWYGRISENIALELRGMLRSGIIGAG